jgi:hypothetical protein
MLKWAIAVIPAIIILTIILRLLSKNLFIIFLR